MTDDVLAELDRWCSTPRTEKNALEFVPINDLLQRARDEIVALREMRDAHVRILSAKLDDDEENMRRWIAKARAEALADCVRICPECANRIKALNTVGANHLRGKLP